MALSLEEFWRGRVGDGQQQRQVEELRVQLAAATAAGATSNAVLGAVRNEGHAHRAARRSLEAKAVRQDHLVRIWVDLEKSLEQAKVGLRKERWELGLRIEHDAFWTVLDGLPFAEREAFFSRMDAEHAPKAANAAERAGAQERKGGPVFFFEGVEMGAGRVGPRYEDIMEVDMLRDAGVLPARRLEASVQQQP